MSNNNGYGCLGFLVSFVEQLFQNRKLHKRMPSPINATAQLPYHRKDLFFSGPEQTLFQVLQNAVGTKLLIFPHVRLSNVIELPRAADRYAAFQNKIQSKQVEFLLVHPDSYKPMLVIELDGPEKPLFVNELAGESHNRERQQESDEFKDAALRAARVPHLRMKVQKEYDPAILRAFITAKLKDAEKSESLESAPNETGQP